MPIQDLKDVQPGQVISAQTFNTLLHEVQRLSNMSVEAPLEMQQGPGGPCFNLGIEVNPFAIRIASSYKGGGVYKAYVISPSFGTNLASLSTDDDIKLGATDAYQPDDEEIVVWNAPERETKSHLLTPNTIVPIAGGGVFLGSIISGTNRRRLLLIDHCTVIEETLKITAVETGLGMYSAQVVKTPAEKEYSDAIATTYVDGTAFSNGDYALNLSDNIVYHRVAGAWVNAAGHLTDTDPDVSMDLTGTASTLFPTTSETVILIDLYEAVARNQDPIIDRLAVGDFVNAKYRSRSSSGTRVFVADGGFRLIDGSADYQGVYWNSGNWTIDWLKIRNA